MDALLSAEGGLAAVLSAGFLAATVVPLSSEAVLFGYLKLHPDHAAAAIARATLGNTAGGMTSYLIGRLIPACTLDARALRWIGRFGSPVTFFAWLAALGFMAMGRVTRYLVVALL